MPQSGQSKKFKVRRATESDLDYIVGQFPAFAKHYGTNKSLHGNHTHARDAMLKTIQEHLVLVAESDQDGVRGFIAGFVSAHPYNPDIRVLTELFWWVEPAFRRTRAAVLLMNEFVAWGKSNCDWVTFGIMETTPVKESAILKRGFIPYERNYIMEVG